MRKKSSYYFGLLSCLVLLLLGCVTNVSVKGTVPTPLVSKIPLDIAIYYDDSFKHFVHSESLKDAGKWQVDLGAQNLVFFKNLMKAMFDSVTEVPSTDIPAAEMALYDGVLIPRIEKYGFLTPGISGLKFFSASIHYRIAVYDENNNKITEFAVVGYGKNESGVFSAGAALGEATMLAIRDGGTRIATEFRHMPEIINWIEAKRGRDHE